MSSLRSRVTPGVSWTTAARVPVSRFTSVDLPTFGKPTIATVPRSSCCCTAMAGEAYGSTTATRLKTRLPQSFMAGRSVGPRSHGPGPGPVTEVSRERRSRSDTHLATRLPEPPAGRPGHLVASCYLGLERRQAAEPGPRAVPARCVRRGVRQRAACAARVIRDAVTARRVPQRVHRATRERYATRR